MKWLTPRLTYLLGFIAICALLGMAAYLQSQGVNPCPLCILQRMTIAVLGIIFFFGAVLNLKFIGNVFIAILSFLIALTGALLSGRQVWLQHMPPDKGADCGASLQYMMQVLPLDQVLKKVLVGGAECSQIGWEFLGVSLAGWSLLCFIAFAVMSLFQLFRSR